MNHTPDPRLHPVLISELRPTQMTVGYREVRRKQKEWLEINQKAVKKSADFLGSHMIPVVLGPKRRPYLIDHHHLARALSDEGVSRVLVTIVANLSVLSKDAFFVVLDNRGWLHPFDAHGRRRAYDDIPKSITKMDDDPYRSLAGELRAMGGYAKTSTPFSEFLWADYMRRRVPLGLVEKDFDKALQGALELARAREADYLPGWCGPERD
ncbi:MAG: chromosome partitioning protein ParB [Hyphomicrobiales bacterium]|nr:chromosome partitioning protein ParB [Hyphomicrobiales bacterium]